MRRKLIEVALPLKEINEESAREKTIRHGHPSTLHLWWARRPLAACRAVLFASLVDDPSSRPEEFPTVEEQDAERERLFDLVRRMVKWDNANDERLLAEIRAEIERATDGKPPAIADPFSGGGSIPLEAQRLGLTAYASDLNPVAVLITKALIEIPPLFTGKPPVHPSDQLAGARGGHWKVAAGLGEDVRYYGEWIRQRVIERIGHLYPKATLPDGREATVIAWLWARTIRCPNPACGFQMPLMRSFDLSKRKGKERHLEPVVDTGARRIRLEIHNGSAMRGATVGRNGAECLACGQPVELRHIRAEAHADRLGMQLTAIVAEGARERIYLKADQIHEETATSAEPRWAPEGDMPTNPRWFSPPGFGMTSWASLFTSRQLTALTTFSDLIAEAREQAHSDALAAGLSDDPTPLRRQGTGARAYAEAIALYLSFAVSKASSRNCQLAIWETGMDRLAGGLNRQAVPMTWDFAETNPLAGAGGDIAGTSVSVAEVIERLVAGSAGFSKQHDARDGQSESTSMVATDPPYYDNIGYADLADFFYVWLRRCQKDVFPEITATVSTPKEAELVASPYRHSGNRDAARAHFEKGLREAFEAMHRSAHPDYPVTLFYAYRQTEETDAGGRVSTGWETMLESLIFSGFRIVGTWPLRTELTGALKKAVNALASSIVLVCRPRELDASVETRQNFVRRLRDEMPTAIKGLQHAALPPVDLGQAAIGPGMAIFSSYERVLEPDGEPMRVREALSEINRTLDEVISEFDADLDTYTRFLVAWYEHYGYSAGPFDEANKLATQKATAVKTLQDEGLLEAPGGSVRLRHRDELPSDWDPSADRRRTAWEACMHLTHRLEEADGGVAAAGSLARALGESAETARDLAYRLYQIATHKGRTEDALAFNSLVVEWPDIVAASQQAPSGQGTLG